MLKALAVPEQNDIFKGRSAGSDWWLRLAHRSVESKVINHQNMPYQLDAL